MGVGGSNPSGSREKSKTILAAYLVRSAPAFIFILLILNAGIVRGKIDQAPTDGADGSEPPNV